MSAARAWRRPLGATGLTVSALGLGAGHIGGEMDEGEVAALLHGALDAGVALIDTACSYGRSEERIGLHLSQRRGEYVLSTKGGYGVPGVADWSAEAITLGIDAALRRLRTENIDIFHLHSCPLAVLQREDILGALEAATRQGKVRVAAYSGENEALSWAIGSGRFGAVQTSVNLFDQGGLAAAVPEAAARGLGVIAKRPLGNAPWRFAERPAGHYAEVYWERMRAMGLSQEGLLQTALRFSAFAPGVSCVIVGTSRLAHLQECLTAAQAGPLPPDEVDRLRAAFMNADRGWTGQV